MSRTLSRALVATAAFAFFISAAPEPAHADATQLCRSFLNVALAPLDVAFAPWITGHDIYYGLTEIDDPVMIKLFGAAPGYVLLNGMQVGGAMFRVISAMFEFVPGLVTLFQEGAQPPLFRNQDETFALYSAEFGPCPVRIGSSYNTINEF